MPGAADDASSSIVFKSARNDVPHLRFLHYNDVYHLEAGSRDPVGGCARFQTLCNFYRDDATFERHPDLLTFFSGDAFNPSLESSVTKGAHMVPVLNQIKTTAACVGNHDLDFGVAQFEHLASRCDFPWLLANVLDPALGEGVPLGNASPYLIVEAPNGIKVGIIGLVEREWLDTINSLPADLIYKSASKTASEIAPMLREQGAEMVIALTHQREPNDEKLARTVPPGTIDIILGGHDHFYAHSVINGVHVLRSGTDFKQLSYIQAWRSNIYSKKWDFAITRRNIVNSIPEDSHSKQLADDLQTRLRAKLEKPIGYTAAPLDARFTTVRLQESNYGNFVCDIMRLYYNTDCALIASGTIRGDQVYPPGVIRLKDLMNCLPFEDPTVVIRVSGRHLLLAVENGVSLYPALEGRFPQVSNITFGFNPNAPPMKRVTWVRVKEQPLDPDRSYLLATRDYMVRGKDGYTALMTTEHGGETESVVSDENGMLLSMLLRQYFLSLKVLGRWNRWNGEASQHWDRVCGSLHQIHPVKPPTGGNGTLTDHFEAVGQVHSSDDEIDMGSDGRATVRKLSSGAVRRRDDRDRRNMLARRAVKHWRAMAKIHRHPDCVDDDDRGSVGWAQGIAPRLEGRIVVECGS